MILPVRACYAVALAIEFVSKIRRQRGDVQYIHGSTFSNALHPRRMIFCRQTPPSVSLQTDGRTFFILKFGKAKLERTKLRSSPQRTVHHRCWQAQMDFQSSLILLGSVCTQAPLAGYQTGAEGQSFPCSTTNGRLCGHRQKSQTHVCPTRTGFEPRFLLKQWQQPYGQRLQYKYNTVVTS